MLDNIRIVIGLVLLGIGCITLNPWFLLGLAPLIVGITKWCPLCFFTGKCKINGKK